MSEETYDEWNERLVLTAHAKDTTRKDPFEKVNGQHGAPMGRPSFGTAPESGIQLFKSRWVDGDYDKGGAYWGYSKRGDFIYAAVDSAIPCRYCRYCRAANRAEAAKIMGLSDTHLMRS